VRPPRSSLGSTVIFALLLAAAVAFGSGCSEDKKTSGSEGEFINVGDAVYQVQLTRLLNPEARPDDEYLRGQPPLSGNEDFLASFVKIENEGDKPYSPPRDMKVVDTQGNQYLPLGTPQSSFGLNFAEPIPPGDSAPPAGSPAEEGPDHSAMVLFRVKSESATDNLPMYLEIPQPSGNAKPAKIRLDI
jgi:hypothetical protein